MAHPTTAKTFNEYVLLNIMPFLEDQMKNTTQCVDAVWDNYPQENTLKVLAQQRRGNDPRTRVDDGSTTIPKREWNSGEQKGAVLIHQHRDLTEGPDLFSIDSVHMQRIVRFVVLMYSKGCGVARVNEARHRLFANGSRSLQNRPPTQPALFQHVKRELLQASFCWDKATSVQQEIPDLSEWGWHKDGTSTWQPLWTTLTDASVACAILLHCACLKACQGRCKCK